MSYHFNIIPNHVETGHWCPLCKRAVSFTKAIYNTNGGYDGALCVECWNDVTFFQREAIKYRNQLNKRKPQ